MARLISHFIPPLNSKNSYPIFSGNPALYDTCVHSSYIIVLWRRTASFSSQSIGDKCRSSNNLNFLKASVAGAAKFAHHDQHNFWGVSAVTSDENFHELLKGEFDLDIPNFEKWNPPILNRQTRVPSGNQRRDWINLSVDFWLDPRLHDAPPTLMLFYIKLLCVRGASGGALSKITLRYLRTRIGTRAYSVERELVKLLKLGLIDVAKKKEKKVSKGEVKHVKTKLTDSPFSFLKKETVKILKKHSVTEFTTREWIKEHGAEKLDRLMPRADQTFIESKIGNPEKWANSKFSNYFDGFVKNHRKGKADPAVAVPEKILKDAGQLLQGGAKT